MSLTSAQRELRKKIYKDLDPFEPLDPAKPNFVLYQPVYQDAGLEDPVRRLEENIELSGVESLQLFSGFRGSGKTTELFRLRKALEEQGQLVLYADALDYINPSEPIEISDLLIVLAGAFDDAIRNHDGLKGYHAGVPRQTFWERITSFFVNLRVEPEALGGKVEFETPASHVIGGLKAGVDFKLALQSSPTFRKNVQKLMSGRIGELKNEAHAFFQEGVIAIQKFFDDERQVVFIFDSLEQLRGSLFNEQEVLQSAARLFSNHLNLLKIPYIHAVYTVPPWFKFIKPAVECPITIPSIRQWENDAARTRYDSGWSGLLRLTQKRFGEQGYKLFFGDDETTAKQKADELIAVCGGHFRDLLRLLREAVRRADSWPVSDEVLVAAVSELQKQFMPIAVNDAKWLDEIGKCRDCVLPSIDPDDVNRLTRFLDIHYVLYLTNGKDWYDTHPLIREEVAVIVARQKKNGRDGDDEATP